MYFPFHTLVLEKVCADDIIAEVWAVNVLRTIHGRVRKLPEPYLAISIRYWRACAVKATFRMVARLLREIPPIQVYF
jgi:hypothetical protein